MLDKIMEMVGGDALKAITGEAGISMDQAKEMLPLAKDSLTEGISSQLSGGGGIDDLLGMFNSVGGGGLANNGIFGSIKGMFVQKIMTGMGLPASVAGLAAGSGLTSIIGSLTGMLQKDGDNDDIDASNIMNVLGGGGALAGILGAVTGGAGGAAGMVGDLAGKILGGASDGAGGVGDLAGKILGGAGDSAGGAADMVGDLASKVLGGAAGGAGDLADGLKGAAGDLLSGGGNAAEGLANVAGDLLGGGGDAAKKAGGFLGSIMKMFGKK